MAGNYNINAILSVTNRFTPQLNQFRQQMSNIRSSVSNATSGVNNFNNTVSRTGSQRSQVASLANSYRQAGMSASQAFRQAWSEIRNTNGAINQASSSTSNFMSKIKGLVVSIGGLVSAKKLIDLSDEQSNLTARINLMNDGMQTTEELQNKIFDAAQRSRGAYTDTAQMVAKLGVNAKDAFSSSAQIVDFAENMNKLFKSGGASAEEQSAGMLQLTQALASGKLQGDEFRSITENAPELIGVLAEKLGKTRAEIKQMSTDGALTSDVIVNAVIGATDDINAKFGSIPKTWADVWKDIKNTALKASKPILDGINWMANNIDFEGIKNNIKNTIAWIGSVVDFKDIKSKISNLVNFIKQHKDIIMPILTGILSAFMAFKSISMVQNVIKGVASALSFITSPIGLVVIGIGALVAGLIYAYKHSEKFRKVCNAAWESVKQKVSNVATKIGECIQAINQWLQEHQQFVENTKTLIRAIIDTIINLVSSAINNFATMFNGVVDIITGVIEIITGIFNNDWAQVWEGCKSVVSGAIEMIKGWWQGLVDLLTAPIDIVVNLFKRDQSEEATLTNATDSREVKDIPGNATGTNNWKGGLTWVGEKGPELVNLPRGTSIHTNAESSRMVENARNNSAGVQLSMPKLADQIIIREEADIDKIGQALANRLEIKRMQLA